MAHWFLLTRPWSQARRYDSRTTTFSPEGRLYQVLRGCSLMSEFVSVSCVLHSQHALVVPCAFIELTMPVVLLLDYTRSISAEHTAEMWFSRSVASIFWWNIQLFVLSQVEYAMEAISHAGICVGILAKDGIVLAVEKKITSKLLENLSSEKMYKVKYSWYLNIACSSASECSPSVQS